MKTFVKTLIVAITVALPLFSNAQDSYIEFAEKGLISKEEAFKAFDNHQKELLRIEGDKQEKEYLLKSNELNKNDNAWETLQDSIPVVIVFGSIVFIVFIIIQYRKTKNNKQKELMEKIIDKGTFNSSQTDSKLLELLLQQDVTVKYSKFITDVTIFGMGLGIIFISNDIQSNEIARSLGFVFLFIGLGRLLVRSLILYFDTQKNKKEKQNKKENIDNTAVETVKTVEVVEIKDNTIKTAETEPIKEENTESNNSEK